MTNPSRPIAPVARTWDQIALDDTAPQSVAQRGRAYLEAAEADREPDGVSIQVKNRKGKHVFELRGTDRTVEDVVTVTRTLHVKANQKGYRFREERVARNGDGDRQRTVVTVQTNGTGTILQKTVKSPTEGRALVDAIKGAALRRCDTDLGFTIGAVGLPATTLAVALSMGQELPSEHAVSFLVLVGAVLGETVGGRVLSALVGGFSAGRDQANARVARILNRTR